jgi:hypothetical protein
MDVVNEAWNGDINHAEPCQHLFHKLKKNGKTLRVWNKSLFSKEKVQLHMALEVILCLDVAQENRALSNDERELRTILKRRAIRLAALERSRKRQASRITTLQEGDANTRF